MKTRLLRRKLLRTGFTTGACAAAAAKAAVLALCKKEKVHKIQIQLPERQDSCFAIKSCIFENEFATCAVIKDAGDDPDITDGIEIQAKAKWRTIPGISISGGFGVGVVTKPGLEISVGMPAINPVPRKMIIQAVNDVLLESNETRGVEIIISIPQGEYLANKTLNPRLGITGGISILGTTGVVIPYSVNAYTACISQAIDIAKASGCKEVVLTTGRRSEKYAQQKLKLPDECFVQAGDYIGYSLHTCSKKRIPKVIIWGMIGKISKLANGHLYTNVSDSVVDIHLLVKIAEDCEIPSEIIQTLKNAITANHFRKLIPRQYLRNFCNRLCQYAIKKCKVETGNKIIVECIITDPDGTIIGKADAEE